MSHHELTLLVTIFQILAASALVYSCARLSRSYAAMIRSTEDLARAMAGRLAEVDPDPEMRAMALTIFRSMTKRGLEERRPVFRGPAAQS
jgi:hypothetical protein